MTASYSLPSGHAALHEGAAGPGDVKIGEGVTIGRNNHARAAPLPSRRKNGQHRGHRFGDGGNAGLLGLRNGWIDFERLIVGVNQLHGAEDNQQQRGERPLSNFEARNRLRFES